MQEHLKKCGGICKIFEFLEDCIHNVIYFFIKRHEAAKPNVVLFLDIDGVLNLKPDVCCFMDVAFPIIDRNCIKVLNELDHNNFKVVLHSDWRKDLGIDKINQYFEHCGANFKISDCVSSEHDKHQAITNYIKDNNLDKAVIVDDDLELCEQLNYKCRTIKAYNPIGHLEGDIIDYLLTDQPCPEMEKILFIRDSIFNRKQSLETIRKMIVTNINYNNFMNVASSHADFAPEVNTYSDFYPCHR